MLDLPSFWWEDTVGHGQPVSQRRTAVRTLLAVVIAAAVLAGCSDSPDASDLTKEQKAALQVLGEIITPPAGYERYREARGVVYARQQVYDDAWDASKFGTDEERETRTQATYFRRITVALLSELGRREEADGFEKAADWCFAELKKSDDQLAEDWFTSLAAGAFKDAINERIKLGDTKAEAVVEVFYERPDLRPEE